jgi:hypothetical protein
MCERANQQAIEHKSNAPICTARKRNPDAVGPSVQPTYLAEEGRLGNQSKIPTITWRASEVEKNPTAVIASAEKPLMRMRCAKTP